MPSARVDPKHAALQSLALPGMGQRKLGEATRGNAMMGVALGSMVLAVVFGYMGLPWAYLTLPFFLTAVLVWVWSILDAHRLAAHQGSDGTL